MTTTSSLSSRLWTALTGAPPAPPAANRPLAAPAAAPVDQGHFASDLPLPVVLRELKRSDLKATETLLTRLDAAVTGAGAKGLRARDRALAYGVGGLALQRLGVRRGFEHPQAIAAAVKAYNNAAIVQLDKLADGTPDEVRRAIDAGLALLEATPSTVPWSVKSELMILLGQAAAQLEQQDLSAQLERAGATSVQAVAGRARAFLDASGENLGLALPTAWSELGLALQRHGVATSVEPQQRGALDALLAQAKPHLAALTGGSRAQTLRAIDAVVALLSSDLARSLPTSALQPLAVALAPALRSVEPE